MIVVAFGGEIILTFLETFTGDLLCRNRMEIGGKMLKNRDKQLITTLHRYYFTWITRERGLGPPQKKKVLLVTYKII